MTDAAHRGGSHGWRREHREGTAGELCVGWPSVDDHPGDRAVAVCRVRAPALVLGSTQPWDLVDHAEAARRDVEVTRRRSGGGAVFVHHDDPVWIDIWVPADDPLFEPDVSRAFWWLGDAWARALVRCGADAVDVVRRPSGRTGGDAVACFERASSGEVVTGDGRKIVGIAQRRVRRGSHFHSACAARWVPGELIDLLSLEPTARWALLDRLRVAAVGTTEVLGAGASTGVVVEAFLDSLP